MLCKSQNIVVINTVLIAKHNMDYCEEYQLQPNQTQYPLLSRLLVETSTQDGGKGWSS